MTHIGRIAPYGLNRTGWLARYLWLLRNPVGFIGQRVMCINLPGEVWPWGLDDPVKNVVVMTDPEVSDKGNEGFCLFTCLDYDEETAWDYYYVKQWCKRYRLVIRMGWKLQHAVTPKSATYVCRINPFKKAPQ